MITEGDAHEIWGVAQLVPGEGIVDGVDRILALLNGQAYNQEGEKRGVITDQRLRNGQPLYTTPPPRKWVGLTDEEVTGLWTTRGLDLLVRIVEAKLKEKNT